MRRTCSKTAADMVTPPGSASASRRAATLIVVPPRRFSCTMISPEWSPMRKVIRSSGDNLALRRAVSACTRNAHFSASTALGNSASTPSPATLNTNPCARSISRTTLSHSAPTRL